MGLDLSLRLRLGVLLLLSVPLSVSVSVCLRGVLLRHGARRLCAVDLRRRLPRRRRLVLRLGVLL